MVSVCDFKQVGWRLPVITNSIRSVMAVWSFTSLTVLYFSLSAAAICKLRQKRRLGSCTSLTELFCGYRLQVSHCYQPLQRLRLSCQAHGWL